MDNSENTKEKDAVASAVDALVMRRKDCVDYVEDRSDSIMKRLRVYFKNGLGISIIRGEYSYGGEKGLFEIMPLADNNPNFDIEEIFDEEDKGDSVIGHLSIERVFYYIDKIADANA